MRKDAKSQAAAAELTQERARRVRAEEANRIKDEFLATLSHELRTPLNAITGWAHILQTGQLAPADRERAVDTILRNAKLQASLIEDLLDVSRIISGKLRLELSPLELATVVEAAVETATPSANAKAVSLSREPASEPIQIVGDAVRLEQVVCNLLSNAVKFTPSGGNVTLRTERVGSHVELVVTDDGAGIAPEFLPFLFERFRQAEQPLSRARGSGLGLGLAIVRYLVEAHKGEVEAKSAGLGHGATFTVSLPLAASQDSDLSKPTESSKADSQALCGAYLLVIDDDPDARELLEVLFAREGAEVALAASASEARRSIRTRHPDVIVCDVGMPEQDGYTFMRALRAAGEEAGAYIPALALTGHAGSEDSRVALLAGFQMHQGKPLDPPRLLENVTKLWRRGVARSS